MITTKEHRLLHYTLAQINASRTSSGASAVSASKRTATPTKQVSTTTANDYAVKPDSSRASQEKSNVAQQNINRLDTLFNNTGTVKTYIDPATGKDSRTFVNGQPVSGSGTFTEQSVQGPQIPTQGLQNNAPVFKSIEEAQKVARDEYTRTGTVSPETEAGLFLLDNPNFKVAVGNNRTSTDVLSDLETYYKGLQDEAAKTGTPAPVGSEAADAPGIIEQIRKLRQAGFTAGVDASGNVVINGASPSGPATAEQIAKNKQNLTGIMNAKDPQSKGDIIKKNLQVELDAIEKNFQSLVMTGSVGPSAGTIAQAKKQSAIDLANLQLQQLGMEVDSALAAPTVSTTTSPSTSGAADATGGVSVEQQYPFDASNPVDSIFSQSAAQAFQTRANTLATIGTADSGQRDASLAAAKQDFTDRLDLIDEIDTVKRDRAEEKQRKLLAENSRMENLTKLENNQQIWGQMQQNEEAEIRARRRVNKLGGGGDVNGLKYIQTEVYRGEQTLNFMKQKALVMDQKYSDAAIGYMNDYYFDLKQADVEKKVGYDEEYRTYKKERSDIKKDFSLDEAERRKQRIEAEERYDKRLFELDMKRGDNMQEMRMKLTDRVFELEDNARADKEKQFDNGIQLMNLIRNKEIASSPETVNYAEKLLGLPSGSLAIIRKAAGDGSSIPGYSSDEVVEAQTAYFVENGKLPSKAEMATMVDVYYKTRVVTGGGMTTVTGNTVPYTYSNPFEALRGQQEETSAMIEFERVQQDRAASGRPSYPGGFEQYKQDNKGGFNFTGLTGALPGSSPQQTNQSPIPTFSGIQR